MDRLFFCRGTMPSPSATAAGAEGYPMNTTTPPSVGGMIPVINYTIVHQHTF
jgi:hypothetical protein